MFFSDDLFQTLSSELGIPVLFDDEIPQKIDNNVDNQIIKDRYIGELSNNFEESNITSHQNSGILFFLLILFVNYNIYKLFLNYNYL